MKRTNQVSVFSSLWGKPVHVALQRDSVVTSGGFVAYDPFDFYYPHGKTPRKGVRESLPYLFVEVDGQNPKQVLSFCKRYGLLGRQNYRSSRDEAELLAAPLIKSRNALGTPPSKWTTADIANTFNLAISNQPRAYRNCWKKTTRMTLGEFESLRRELEAVIELIEVADRAEDREAREMAKGTLDCIFSRKFRGARVHPTHDPFTDSWSIWWDVTSLETVMYAMVMQDMAGPGKILLCPDPACRAPFLSRHPRKRFCSLACQNRLNQRTHREQKKSNTRTKRFIGSRKETNHGKKGR